MEYLTADQHRIVVERLVGIPGDLAGVHTHNAGIEYTSLMVCFLMHMKSGAESLLALHGRNGTDWFPVATGYVVARSLFEVDVNAHYISADPITRSRRYIEFEHVIDKNTLEAIERHRISPKPDWREGMQLTYNAEFAPRKAKIEANYEAVRTVFEDAKGKRFKWWSGKSLYAMAKDVDHVEAYDVFYGDLSAFTHVNVKLANQFIRLNAIKSDGPLWTQRANEFHVAKVFRYAAIFLTCFLEHFGQQFGTWDATRVLSSWDFPEPQGS